MNFMISMKQEIEGSKAPEIKRFKKVIYNPQIKIMPVNLILIEASKIPISRIIVATSEKVLSTVNIRSQRNFRKITNLHQGLKIRKERGKNPITL